LTSKRALHSNEEEKEVEERRGKKRKLPKSHPLLEVLQPRKKLFFLLFSRTFVSIHFTILIVFSFILGYC